MPTLVRSVEHPEIPPFEMPDRFRTDVAYFMAARDAPGTPPLMDREYWIPRESTDTILADGVFLLVSPLSSERPTEVELSEAQEEWLRWMQRHNLQHIRVE